MRDTPIGRTEYSSTRHGISNGIAIVNTVESFQLLIPTYILQKDGKYKKVMYNQSQITSKIKRDQ